MDSRRGDAQGPALLILFPNSSLAELRACLLLRVLTLTRLFSGSLCEIRASLEPRSSVRRRRVPGGAGVTMNWKPFGHRPQTMKNRLGWDQSKRLLCANLHTALVDYLCLGKLTQRETDLPAASHGRLDQHFSAYHATRPFGEKNGQIGPGNLAFSPAGSLLPLLNRGPTAG